MLSGSRKRIPLFGLVTLCDFLPAGASLWWGFWKLVESQTGTSFGGRGSNQALDLVRTIVVLASCFTPGLNQVM